MERSKDFYHLLNPRESLLDYLRYTEPMQNTSDAERHKEICGEIRKDPSFVGISKRVLLFEARPFKNIYGKIIVCPDFVGWFNSTYFIVEVGTNTKNNRQLYDAFRILVINYSIHPKLLKVKYDGAVVIPRTIDSAVEDCAKFIDPKLQSPVKKSGESKGGLCI